ncbi:TetR/AcrR family transcriptional regulator [Desulfovibrio sp. JC010]|uniref:TetR/AcrR family transcriptional regulator n=1 Tax=Desulfovibrio sp. JC010 TaxID=2593641 RepID=UPI0013D2913C|nr:TetR/AcrR family transcriptional regulator [Desulfovibrio sp. JC010]NDV27542.1 TetR/AcrR family transcriptional regulator [Desulfovibrio sp. JC010]
MDNKEKILACALKLFGSKGYEATGVQEIVKQAGVTKPTLYHYFGSKKGLLEVLLDRYYQELVRDISAAARYEDDLEQSLTKVAKAFFNFAEENKDFYRMQLAMVFGPKDGDPVRIIEKVATAPYLIMQGLFAEALKDNDQITDNICMGHAITFIGIVHQYIALYLNEITDLSDTKVDFIVKNFLYGIGS